MKKNNKREGLVPTLRAGAGITFIELLIVISLVAVISLTVYSTLDNGLRIWQKINTQVQEEDLNIFFDRISSEIRNSFNFKGLAFSGAEDKCSFMTFVNNPALGRKTIGRVTYCYDSSQLSLTKQQQDFSQIYAGQEALARNLMRNVEFLKFNYYRYDEALKEYLWVDEWNEEELPLAIKITLEIKDAEDVKNFTKTISIPVSS